MISKMISNGESEAVEFKETFRDEALETIGALANNQGGTLLIGVGDSGAVTGTHIGKKTLEDLSNRIQEATEPRIQPSVTIHQINGKDIIAIEVSKAIRGPVSVRGRYFRRVGKTNQRMSHEEIMQTIAANSGLSWDGFVDTSATIADLDTKKVEAFISAVKKFNRRPIPENFDPIDALRKLELVTDAHPTRAALLLFGTHIDRRFPSAFLKIGRFRSPTLIVDDLEIHETLFEQVEQTMNWFRQRLETAFIITGKPQRDVIWEFPLDAIREALINAVCHRDYLSAAHSQIRLYDDRLVIRNAGGLPSTLKTEMLLQDHDSIPRNRKIADAFFCAGLIEKWGSGTTRIANELHSANMPAPEFVSDAWSFQVTFHKNPFTHEQSNQLGLSERQIKALEFIKTHGEISNSQYQKLTGVSKPSASRELRDLALKGILKSSGIKGAGSFFKLAH